MKIKSVKERQEDLLNSTFFNSKDHDYTIRRISYFDGGEDLVEICLENNTVVKTFKISTEKAVEIGFINPNALINIGGIKNK